MLMVALLHNNDILLTKFIVNQKDLKFWEKYFESSTKMRNIFVICLPREI